jgi:predicted MPP superfamily phosphohydrolase
MSVGVSLKRFMSLAIGSVDYAKWNSLEITRLRVALPNLPRAFDGLTLVQVSDLHMGEWMTLSRMQYVAEQVNALRPDVIALTGDFVGALRADTPSELSRSLRALRAREGIFGVLGNHDHYTHAPTVRRAIRNAGNVQLLSNENAIIERGEQRLYIAGLDDIERNQHDLPQALNGIPHSAAVILLAHEPDYADEVAKTGRVGLQLSGHTHGGQVRVPGIGAPVLPVLGRKYPMGLYVVDDLLLYVNRGVGMVSLYLRVNCRPEITHITLTSAS